MKVIKTNYSTLSCSFCHYRTETTSAFNIAESCANRTSFILPLSLILIDYFHLNGFFCFSFVHNACSTACVAGENESTFQKFRSMWHFHSNFMEKCLSIKTVCWRQKNYTWELRTRIFIVLFILWHFSSSIWKFFHHTLSFQPAATTSQYHSIIFFLLLYNQFNVVAPSHKKKWFYLTFNRFNEFRKLWSCKNINRMWPSC